MEQGPCQSFASVRNVSKVYHPMIRLINGTAVEQRTWLKCKYPKCKWLNWIIGNYKVSSWDLFDFVNGPRGCKYQTRFSLLKRMQTENNVSCHWLMSWLTEIRINFKGQAVVCFVTQARDFGLISRGSKCAYTQFQELCLGRGKHKHK